MKGEEKRKESKGQIREKFCFVLLILFQFINWLKNKSRGVRVAGFFSERSRTTFKKVWFGFSTMKRGNFPLQALMVTSLGRRVEKISCVRAHHDKLLLIR